MKIVLVGFMGTGKSATGRVLARLLGLEFIDTDALVEARAGRDIASIFRCSGEAAFRRLEKEVIREAGARDGVVIATGGGALLDPANRACLARGALVVALTAAAAEIRRRLAADGGRRPLLPTGEHSAAVSLEALLARRRPCYETADVVVATDGKTPAAVAGEIAALAGPAGGRP